MSNVQIDVNDGNKLRNNQAVHFTIGCLIVFFLLWSLVSGFTQSVWYSAFSRPQPMTEGGVMVAASGFDLAAQFASAIVTGIGAIGVAAWCGLLNVIGNVIAWLANRGESVNRTEIKQAFKSIVDDHVKLRDETETAMKKVVDKLAKIENHLWPPPPKPKTAEEQLAELQAKLAEKGISLDDEPKPTTRRKVTLQ